MIVNLTRAQRCVRCKQPDKGRLRAAIQINIPSGRWSWLAFKFRICRACADQMVERAEHNPKLRRVD